MCLRKHCYGHVLNLGVSDAIKVTSYVWQSRHYELMKNLTSFGKRSKRRWMNWMLLNCSYSIPYSAKLWWRKTLANGSPSANILPNQIILPNFILMVATNNTFQPKWVHFQAPDMPMCAPHTPYCDVKKTFDCSFLFGCGFFYQIGWR